MAEIYGNLDESATYVDFDYDAVDGYEAEAAPPSGLDILNSWCQFCSLDIRLSELSKKVAVFERTLEGGDLLSGAFAGEVAVTNEMLELGLFSKDAQKLLKPIVAWIVGDNSKQGSAGKRHLVFIYCMAKKLLPFESLEELGMWMGVSKVRAQHLINDFYESMGVKYQTNKTGKKAVRG